MVNSSTISHLLECVHPLKVENAFTILYKLSHDESKTVRRETPMADEAVPIHIRSKDLLLN